MIGHCNADTAFLLVILNIVGTKKEKVLIVFFNN